MTFANPAFIIPRRSVFQPAGEAGMWAKVFDPPTASPKTPEFLNLNNLPLGVKANPVPEVMLAAGFQDKVSNPHTVQRDLMHGMKIPTWDHRPGDLVYFLFRDGDNPATGSGNYPAAAIRLPRASIFHAETSGHGPPPHTIHWHGIEPTPMNDGVGHCSVEIGQYTYQWQPNSIGTYFYHCHRNTVQHFEFGLFGLIILEPPDAYFASIASTNPDGSVVLNNIPIGAGTDGKRRIEANTSAFPQFPGFVAGDPINGAANGDPHAFTVPYDVEAFWVLDDRDSAWSDFAPDPFAFMARNGGNPGVNDEFKLGFFHDYNADYWFVTGVPVIPLDGQKRIPNVGLVDPANTDPAIGGLPGGVIPPALNSGVSGTQVAVHAQRNQTILIRILDAAYNAVKVTLPVDALITATDGRSFGVPPFGRYSAPFLLKAGTPLAICTAHRFDALIRSTTAVNSFATVDFFESRGGGNVTGKLLQTARIPFVIT
jgi:hypothetical protein